MDKRDLFQIVKLGFNGPELQELCLDLGIDHEDLGSGTTSQKIIELLGYCERRQELFRLERTCRILRPHSFQDFVPPAQYSRTITFPFHNIIEALSAIERLSQPKTWPLLQITKPLVKSGWIGSNSKELVDILYAIYQPIIRYKLAQNEIERNFSLLDWRTRIQFLLLEFVVQAILHDSKIAALEPKIQYTPRVPGWRWRREQLPRQYWWQGLSQERFDNAIDAFCRIDADNANQLMSAPEFHQYFQRLFVHDNNAEQQAIGLAGNALYGFTPSTRPVYWRILVIQSRLYRAITKSRSENLRRPTNAADLYQLFDMSESVGFPYSKVDSECENFEPFTTTFNVATEFLKMIVIPNVVLKLNASEYLDEFDHEAKLR